MVYESDFYTTRRPYSRPLASSYSITTTPVVLPLSAVIQLRGYLPRMPYIAHKRLVTVIHSPVHNVYYSGSMIPIRIHSRVRPSVIAAELKRIRDLPRPSTESYTEHYLNSKDHIYFDDEAKEIRARVDSLLRRVHVYIPRACPSDFAEEIVPERMRSGDYIRRLISGKNNAKKDAEAVSWYDVPERGHFGNLACVKYVAGKPQSIRRPYYKVADLRPSDIKNDVKFLSYYQKNRQAAADASPDQPMTERELRKARALETEWSESIVKREVKPILEEKTNVAEKKTNLPEEKITVPEEKKTVAEETKDIAEEKVTVVEEKKVIAEEKENLIEEKKALAEEPIKEEVKPKAKLAKESKIKKSKQVEVEKKVETKVETPKVKEIPVKEPSKEPEELLAEPAKEKVEKVEEEIATTESLESTQKQLEIVEEPPKEEPSKEVPVEIEVAKVQESENLSEEKTEEKATIESKVESTVESKVEAPIEPTVETVAIDTAETVEESKPEVTQQVETKSVEEAEIIEATPATENTELVSEKDQPEGETEEVKQNRQDAAKRAEEYLLKVAEESRTEEEKKQAVEIQLTKYEMEEEKAWEALQIDLDRKAHLNEILEVERAEAERKIEEEKLEKERTEIIRLEEAERQINAEKLRALMEEEERMLIEERAEEVRQRQEREERLAEVSLGITDDKKDADYSREDQLFTEITDQEMEEKPYELPPTDEDTKIEEENVVEYEVEDISMDPFVEEPDGQSRPVPSGGTAIVEENFEWPDEEA
ncbi:calponin homology domain-containing protein DDB_G0272472-like isoform X1 [Vespula pensylvanica]|uniref:calponin homology domain-containing protein DDB_G0272472-like isoform X1 n=1 Tax=Vespula pensylvanica TaxID=30213 RepID=UPI001CBA0D7B|nr:calponin homology domain-containing protein DDB_G0272472-like isoform X1 [Vespula pensylvanica]